MSVLLNIFVRLLDGDNVLSVMFSLAILGGKYPNFSLFVFLRRPLYHCI